MAAQKPKILLSEGSSLSSREAITALGLAGHRVELVSSNPMCLGRFSRFVSRVHRAPASGADPDGYLAAVIEIVKRITSMRCFRCMSRLICLPPRANGFPVALE